MANNQAKNILIFSTAYLPLIGGAEIAVEKITQRLPDWQFDLITAKIKPSLDRYEKIGQVNIYRVGLGIGFLDKFLLPFFGFLKAKELDKERNYSIIWSIMASQAGIAASFFKMARSDKKLLLTLQEGDKEEHLKRYVFNINFLYKILIKPWHLLPFKKADRITAISSDLKKRALENGVKVPIKIIPNGVDLNLFKPIKKVIQSDERVILTVSRLVKKNGVDDLIKSGKYLNFPFKILIIGIGPDQKKLEKLVKKLDLEEKVKFVGQVPYEQLPEYYSLADVFVRPSLSEGLGNVFLEAMAVGVPIIGTPVGGIFDFLIDRGTGLFCQVKNSKDIAKKITEILENDSLQRTIVVNGLELVRDKYSWDNIALKIEEVFEDL